jgi:hypothetical protein
VIGCAINIAAHIIVNTGVNVLITDESMGVVNPNPNIYNPWFIDIIKIDIINIFQRSLGSIFSFGAILDGNINESMIKRIAPPAIRIAERAIGVIAPVSNTPLTIGDIPPHTMLANNMAPCAITRLLAVTF